LSIITKDDWIDLAPTIRTLELNFVEGCRDQI